MQFANIQQVPMMNQVPPQYIPEAEVVHAALVGVGVMSPTDVSRVLDSLNLSKYGPLFEKERIDGSLLLTLDDASLQEIGGEERQIPRVTTSRTPRSSLSLTS